MANGGFFEQKSASPTRFALVAAGHAAVLAAVMLAAGPNFTRTIRPPTDVDWVELPQPPDEVKQERSREDRPVPVDRVVVPLTPVDLPPRPDDGLTTTGDTGGVNTGAIPTPPRDPIPVPDPPAPVRVDAQIDPRYASALQPQYPAAEQRAGRAGTVVIRVTIGADGRVRSAQRVSATSDLFWAAAERQALTRWRFRPATVDGRPVESTRTMTIHFRIEDV